MISVYRSDTESRLYMHDYDTIQRVQVGKTYFNIHITFAQNSLHMNVQGSIWTFFLMVFICCQVISMTLFLPNNYNNHDNSLEYSLPISAYLASEQSSIANERNKII